MDAYRQRKIICQSSWSLGAMWIRIVQPHGSYCSWTPSFSGCWGLLVVEHCRRPFLIGQKRIRWVEAPQYKHSPLVRRNLRSASVSGARARSISIGTGSLDDDIGGVLKMGCHIDVAHSSWWSSKSQLSQLTTSVIACNKEVGSGKLSSRFWTSLWRPRRKWSQSAWLSHWTSHANCRNSEA